MAVFGAFAFFSKPPGGDGQCRPEASLLGGGLLEGWMGWPRAVEKGRSPGKGGHRGRRLEAITSNKNAISLLFLLASCYY